MGGKEKSSLNQALIIYTTLQSKIKITCSRFDRIKHLEMPQKYPIFNKDIKPKLQKKGNNYIVFCFEF